MSAVVPATVELPGAAASAEADATVAPPADEPITAALRTLGACRACLRRIAGCRDTAPYLEAAESRPGVVAADACGLCLGLLERSALLRSELREQLSKADFEGSVVELTVAPPVLCVLRHQVLLCYLRSLLRSAGHVGEPDCIELKDVLRWVLIEELAALGLSPRDGLQKGSTSELAIGITAACEYAGEAASELDCFEPPARSKPSRKRRRFEAAKAKEQPPPCVSASTVQEALANLDAEECCKRLGTGELTNRLKRVPGSAEVRFSVGRESLFLRGRYLKLGRTLPQSPWIIDGVRKGDGSVEEHITSSIARCFGATSCAFHAEGREDIDVRMLGCGRPFVVEVKHPRLVSPASPDGCKDVEEAVNAAARDKVAVRRLARCPASAMAALQRDAENHRKTYVCVCWSQRALADSDLAELNARREMEVMQKTPVRVLHRRTLAIRPKMIHWLQAELINAHYLRVRLSTQAGMYIKEFVHGDLGRTEPSLKSMLKSQVDILQLDVEGLEDDDEGESAGGGSSAVVEGNDGNSSLATASYVDSAAAMDYAEMAAA